MAADATGLRPTPTSDTGKQRTMKVARLYSATDIRVEEIDRPVPGPGQALVRTRACGICTGDIMGWYLERRAPLVFGHEPAGDIVALGEGAADVVATDPQGNTS